MLVRSRQAAKLPSPTPKWRREREPHGLVRYSAIGLDDALEATVEVRNISSRSVEEVAQLYLHRRYGRAARPVRELKAFQRLTLDHEEIRTLHFAIPASARRYWSTAEEAYVLNEAPFDVWVGGASTASLHAEFAVERRGASSTV